MFNWVYVISSGEFLYGGPCDVTPTEGHAVVRLDRHPDPYTERYDGDGGIRPATRPEGAAGGHHAAVAGGGAGRGCGSC